MDTAPSDMRPIRVFDVEQIARQARAKENAAAEQAKSDKDVLKAEGNGDALPGVATGEAIAEGKPGEALGNIAEGVGSAVSGAAGIASAALGDKNVFPKASTFTSADGLRSNTQHADPYKTTDSGMSWGMAGQTQATVERNAETIQPAAKESMAIAPSESGSTVSPVPEVFPGPASLQPTPSRGASTFNMSRIAETKIG
jgi:hypothetical protein